MEYILLEDEQLMTLLKESDTKAFKEIYNRYWKEIFLVAYTKTHSKEVAEELTQSLFEAVWVKRQKNNIENLRYYLFAGIKNRIINYFKTKALQRKYENLVLQKNAFPNENSSEQLIYEHDLTTAIQKGISLLPSTTRSIYQLSRVDQFSVKEISEKMNLSEKAVEYHITKFMKAMRHYLKEFLLHTFLILYSLYYVIMQFS